MSWPPKSAGTRPAQSPGPVDSNETRSAVPDAPARRNTFIVKLRDIETRSWGNQTEIVAASARDAAEQATGGEQLLEGPGERANLRARVWETPFGSAPDLSFYTGNVAQPS